MHLTQAHKRQAHNDPRRKSVSLSSVEDLSIDRVVQASRERYAASAPSIQFPASEGGL